MFFFRKAKPVLKDLLPENYIDIHSHLLFGIDDGAKTFDDTLNLAKSLMKIGVSQFITTPHTLTHVWDNSREDITSKSDITSSLLKSHNITVPFKSASEYILDSDLLTRFETEKLLTLKDSYVLVEMSYLNPPMQLYSILFDLQVAGYKPVLAHPERYVFYHTNFEEYAKLKKAGCLFQINLLSSVGYYGAAVSKIADKLLEANMIDFAGSDVHHTKHVAGFENRVILKNAQHLQEAMRNNEVFRI